MRWDLNECLTDLALHFYMQHYQTANGQFKDSEMKNIFAKLQILSLW